MVRMLNEIPGVVCPEPQGAFYAYPSVKGLLGKEIRGRRPQTSAELAELILDEAEVAVVPGEAFGTPGLLPAVLRAGRRRPGRRRYPHRQAAGRRHTRRMTRPLTGLPKAHLHLHFTGSMRHATLVELADSTACTCPTALVEDWPPTLAGADERGWFRFQRLYDIARSVLRTPADMRRLVRETAEDERARGLAAGWRSRSTRPGTRPGSAASPSTRAGPGRGARGVRARPGSGWRW